MTMVSEDRLQHLLERQRLAASRGFTVDYQYTPQLYFNDC